MDDAENKYDGHVEFSYLHVVLCCDASYEELAVAAERTSFLADDLVSFFIWEYRMGLKVNIGVL